jgi:ketosteroid isomerase-like protein
VEGWLHRFAAAVRDRDYDAARGLFDPEVVAFGTVAERLDDLDALVARQWRQVWPATCGFAFDDAGVRVASAGALVFVAATWSSTEYDAERRAQPRRGRATLVLRRCGARWLAVHSHFSLRPPAGREA